MIKSATSKSLLIIDELGRGTSTTEGFGIAWGIARYIVEDIGCFALFATHFHEMTLMEQKSPGVKNFFVNAISKMGRLTMLYKVQRGFAERSFGIFVAGMLDFPEEIMVDAKAKLKDLEPMKF